MALGTVAAMALVTVGSIGVSSMPYVTRERKSPMPDRMVKLGRTNPSLVLPSLDIALTPARPSALEHELAEISDPRSRRYGEWLAEDAVTALVEASPDAIDAVTTWLAAGAGTTPELNNHRDWLLLRNVTAATVESLLGAELHQHVDTVTGQVLPRIAGGHISMAYIVMAVTDQVLPRIAGAYRLPAAIASHVLKVLPIHSVGSARLHPRTQTIDGGLAVAANNWPHDCTGLTSAGMITPAVARARYNFSVPLNGSGVGGSIAAMLPGPVGVVDSEIKFIQRDCGLPDHPLGKVCGLTMHSGFVRHYESRQVCGHEWCSL